jgi:hypothetical protein
VSTKQERAQFQAREKQILEARVAYIAMSLQSFWDMTWYRRAWWLLTGQFDASRSLRAYQAAQEASTSITASAEDTVTA